MTNAFRHTGVLLMVAIIGLAVVGAAYALWFQVLTLKASVTTGTLDVQWSDHGADPAYSLNLGDTFVGPNDPDFNRLKVVQTCDQVLDETGHVLTITDTGLYPYAGCSHHIDIHNNGTVPVHIDTAALQFTGLGCDANGENCQIVAQVSACENDLVNGNQDPPPSQPDANNPSLWQLHPSNRINCDVLLYAAQSAAENTTYSGTASLLACQWNEDVNCSFDNTGGRENNETPTATATEVPPTPTPTPAP
ncbi:MAG: hypothetical protein EPO22_08250 [Dehalococcoidia bacterium]|nr:MAG: hypothetical protein EPO22_08250 [Dehalococcoidia bacterium]